MFTFQKGVGSSNVDPNQLPPEAQAALARMAEAQSARPAQAQAPARAEGFANGLHDAEDMDASQATLAHPSAPGANVPGGNSRSLAGGRPMPQNHQYAQAPADGKPKLAGIEMK
jgi:hypothetical protein